MPRFALANNFYRGELTNEFKDLTWVEEMACAIYHNNAYISHIYLSPVSSMVIPVLMT